VLHNKEPSACSKGRQSKRGPQKRALPVMRLSRLALLVALLVALLLAVQQYGTLFRPLKKALSAEMRSSLPLSDLPASVRPVSTEPSSPHSDSCRPAFKVFYESFFGFFGFFGFLVSYGFTADLACRFHVDFHSCIFAPSDPCV
jgi:hypothetical protein